MNKKNVLVLLLIFVLLIVPACDSKNGTKEFYDKANKAKEDVESLKMDSSFTVKTNGKISTQVLKVDAMYSDMMLYKAYALSEGSASSDLKDQYIETVLRAEDNELYMYTKLKNDKEWKRQKATGFFINPDYFNIIDIVFSIKDSLVIEEAGEEYQLVFDKEKGKDVDLFELFKDEFGLNVSGIKSDDLDKNMVFIFDKKTHFLKSVKLDFHYNGKAGKLILKANVDYSGFNEVNEDSIDDKLK